MPDSLLPRDGLVIVAKRDCPTCTMVEPVMQSLDRAGPLIVPDGKHPSAQAIYLEAATLYALIFRASPRELPNLFVPTAKATRLRAVAATALGY